MFRCQTCRGLSTDKEKPSLGCKREKCNYTPQKVPLIHYTYVEGKKRIVACTGKTLIPGGIVLGLLSQTTCLRCIDTMNKKRETVEVPEQSEVEEIEDETETEESELPTE